MSQKTYENNDINSKSYLIQYVFLSIIIIEHHWYLSGQKRSGRHDCQDDRCA